MVRRSEIACSKGWKKDLWETRGDAPADQSVAVSPLVPASAAEIAAAAMFAHPIRVEVTGQAGDEPRDVVVGEQPCLWRAEPEPRPIDVPLSDGEIRVAEERGGSGTIRRAHELQRERHGGRSRHVDLPFRPEGVTARPDGQVDGARGDVQSAGTDDMITGGQPEAGPATGAPDTATTSTWETIPLAGSSSASGATGAPAAFQETPRLGFDVARGEPLASRPTRWARSGGIPSGDDGVAGHLPELHGDHDGSPDDRATDATADPLPRPDGVPWRLAGAGERPAPVLSWRQGGATRTGGDARPGGEPYPNEIGPISHEGGTRAERGGSSPEGAPVTGRQSGATPGVPSPVPAREVPGASSAAPVSGGTEAEPGHHANNDPLVAVTMAERRQWRQRWQSSELVADGYGGAGVVGRPASGLVDRPVDDAHVAERRPASPAARPRLHDRATSGDSTRAATVVAPPSGREGRAGQDRIMTAEAMVSRDENDYIDLPLVSPRSQDPRQAASGHAPIRIAGQGEHVQAMDRDGATRWASRIASVPRTCATCRDFRPAESGERGWCTNTHAFTHRRMVAADERPCESIIGSWWLPHDMVWLGTDDIQAHGLPTPLVDTHLTASGGERLKG
ncbi:MAG: hypothetical protein M3462_05885 [Chloroflexota bacterium]|nr:hypothetical protein [Chloroflexota bacterium]